jgi:hypothetical protein
VARRRDRIDHEDVMASGRDSNTLVRSAVQRTQPSPVRAGLPLPPPPFCSIEPGQHSASNLEVGGDLTPGHREGSAVLLW